MDNVEKVMKRMIYEQLVNSSNSNQKDKDELLKKDDKHIDAVLKTFNIKINNL